MPNAIAPVANALNNHRGMLAGAAAITAGAVVIRRVKLWKEFITDPETFNAKHPAA